LYGTHFQLFTNFVVAEAHETLDRINCIFGVGSGLASRNLADEYLASLRKSDDRWCGAAAFFVGDDLSFAAIHHRDNRIADRFTHDCDL
jgi:hypothetical protein